MKDLVINILKQMDMDIKEKMKMCFNQELLENTILTENEKKVLASLMYSYKICSKAKDNTIIRSMDALRKDIQISTKALYDAIRSLQSLYHMIERTAGESRGKEKSSIASKFKLNFDAIFNPPKEHVRFDFSKELKSSETSISVVDTDKDIVKDIGVVVDINNDVDTIKNIDNDIEINEDIVNISGNDVVFENEVNNIEINYDIYKDEKTWKKSLPNDIDESYYNKEVLLFQLYQLHDYYSILDKIEEISINLRRNNDEKFKEKALYIINEKSNEIGYHFSLYV